MALILLLVAVSVFLFQKNDSVFFRAKNKNSEARMEIFGTHRSLMLTLLTF